jgi:two-component system sensor histidine kinase ComP
MNALRQIPLGKRYLFLVLLMIPIFLDVYIDDKIGEFGWLLYVIPAFVSSYYLGLKGGLLTAAAISIIFSIFQICEYTYEPGSFQEWEILIIPMVIGINFAFTIGAGLISNKMKRQQLQLIQVLKDLENKQKDLKDLFNDLDTTLWSYNVITKQLIVSASLEKNFGYSHKEFEQNLDLWLKFIHPDDFEITQEFNRKLNEGYSSVCQHRIIRPDGSIRWVENRANPIFDDSNILIKLHGVLIDITDTKNSEAMYKLMADNVTDLVCVLDPRGTYLYLSPSHHKMLGNEIKGWEGATPFDNIHPDDVERVKRDFFNLVETRSINTIVFRCLHANGDLRCIEAQGTPVLGRNGEVENIVVVGRDITEKVEVEQAFKASWELYIRLLTSLDHFSGDLAGIMNQAELEKKLVDEVQTMLTIKSVSILEIDPNLQTVIWKYGVENATVYDEIRGAYYSSPVQLCKLQEMKGGCFLKIGSTLGKDSVLLIGEAFTFSDPLKIWLQTITRYVNVLYDNFRVIGDLIDEIEHMSSELAPSWLLRLIFNLSESERKCLSQDLHDGALQEQIIWYRKLNGLKSDVEVSDDVRKELGTISEGLLDVIYQIRLTCNELRPPMLKEFGLVESLENLFESTELRTDYEVIFDSSGFESNLSDEQLIGIFRIVQELLANAAKHSKADIVQISLSTESNQVMLRYKDNGIGLSMLGIQNGLEGMGIRGMKERIRSLEGKIDLESSHSGLSIQVTIPNLHI